MGSPPARPQGSSAPSGPRPGDAPTSPTARPDRPASWRSREAALVAGLVLLALVLRLPTAGLQSFWLDEVYTGRIVDGSLGHAWSTVQRTENTPPLFYLLDWGWGRLFGTSEFALRSLSALAGALAVLPVARLVRSIGEATDTGRGRAVPPVGPEPAGPASAPGVPVSAGTAAATPLAASPGHAERLAAGLVEAMRRPVSGEGRGLPLSVVLAGGLLVVVSPLAHWFSQEARSYALFVLLSGLAWLALVRALREPTPRALGLWAVAAAAATWTHYFGGLLFLVGWSAIVVVLVAAAGDRRRAALRPVLLPAGLSAVGVLALLPIALNQQSTGMYEAISKVKGLPDRIVETPKQFAVGYSAPAEAVTGAVVVLVLTVLVAAGAWPRGGRATRGTVLLGLVATVWLLPLVALAGGFDVVLTRNFVLLLPPLFVLAALGAGRLGRGGLVALGAVTVAQVAVIVLVALTPVYQREDWRGIMAAAQDGQPAPELLFITAYQGPAATYYSPTLRRADPRRPVALRSLAVVDRLVDGKALKDAPVPQPPPGFVLSRVEQRDQWHVFVWTAPRPTRISPELLRSLQVTPPRTAVLRP
ncbi:hypothetical protein [Patulibacter sp.]|uniref:hypothetical protein n=1 Tax=Patulibacter sp. TaxID=1912859 RepID=UPI00271AAB14|nr:hypothetical protein [Patulibacter sp.]MDO9410172.1 hypothetical protein [Patulibacter sp.]